MGRTSDFYKAGSIYYFVPKNEKAFLVKLKLEWYRKC